MSCQANNPREKPKGNPYPIRGKIKEKICEDFYKLFTDPSGSAGGEERGRDGGDGGSSPTTPSPGLFDSGAWSWHGRRGFCTFLNWGLRRFFSWSCFLLDTGSNKWEVDSFRIPSLIGVCFFVSSFCGVVEDGVAMDCMLLYRSFHETSLKLF